MVRPFRYGDIFLVQRLSRQATKLNIVQATLHRQSAVGSSLSSILPWNHGKATTYILRQRGHSGDQDARNSMSSTCRPVWMQDEDIRPSGKNFFRSKRTKRPSTRSNEFTQMFRTNLCR